MKKITSFFWGHKIISLFVLVAIFFGGYFGFKKIYTEENVVKYTTAAVEKGILISSVSGTGQISASSQVDISPKVSGDIVSINVTAGQTVKAGDLIAQIDSRDAVRSLNEAKASLENAKLDFENLLAPTDEYTLIQAEHALEDAEDSLTKLKTSQKNNYDDALANKQKAEDNLEKAYEDAYNAIANAYLDLPDILTGLYTVLYGEEIADNEVTINYNNNNTVLINTVFNTSDDDSRDYFEKELVNKAEDNYKKANKSYDESYDNYKNTSRYSPRTVIDNLLEETIDVAKKISDTVKSEANMLDWWVANRTDNNYKVFSQVTNFQSDLASYTSKVNGHLSSLLSVQRSIEDYLDSIKSSTRSFELMEQNNPLELAAAERSLAEKKQRLADLESGASELDIKSKELSVQQRQNSLVNAQQNYADHFIRAPFEGTIASVNIAKGDSAGSGSSIATLITDQRVAEITLNEIDAAKIKAGQKATLEFDAVAGLSITGDVVEVDTIGTINQGIVSYDVKIAFDVQDEGVKPGMSVSVNIITESKANVLLAPVSAVKTMGNGNYVEVLVNGQPQRKTVIIGLSNDTMIEIIEGLAEGDEIITQTISSGSSQASQTEQRSTGGFGGASFRMLR